MSSRFTLLLAILALCAATALGQGFSAAFYELDQPLTEGCIDGQVDPNAPRLPDGTLVYIFWDDDSDGVDTDDGLAPVGPAPGEVNYNFFPLNGCADIGECGLFATLLNFVSNGQVPVPARYYLRVCGPNITITSNVVTLVTGPQDVEFTTWTCEPVPCAGCPSPPAPANVQASDNSCTGVTITWTYPLGVDSVDAFKVYRNSEIGIEFLATVPYVETDPNYLHTDNTGQISLTYQYLIEARRVCGVGDTAYSVRVSDGGTRRPFPPIPTSVTASNNYCDSVVVNFTYNTNLGVDTFYIKRAGVIVGGVPAEGQPGTRRFRHSGAPAGVAAYTVVGHSPFGCGEGTPSDPVNGNNIDLVAPANVIASDDLVGIVTVTWSDIANETGYQIWRAAEDGSGPAQVGTVGQNVTTFQDACVDGAPPRRYWIIATGGTCGPGDASQYDLGRCGQNTCVTPTGVAASDNSCEAVTVTWADVANETGYRVYRDAVQVGEVGAGVLTFMDTPAAGTYSYTVTSLCEFGESTPSTPDAGTRLTVPGQVTGLTASNNSCFGIQLSWAALPNVTSFIVNRDDADIQTINNGAAVSYFDSSATEGNHTYTVRAANACGTGPASAPATGTRLPGAPAQPQNFVATDGQCDGTHLSWTDVATETSYQVWRANEDGSSPAQIASNSADDVTYDDLTGNVGTVYRYWVVASNACGNSAPSNFDNGSRLDVPGAPAGLSATETSCVDICLTWNGVAGATSYQIFRDGILLATVTAPNYCDATAVPGTQYAYTVRAVNTCGVSNPSNSDIGRRLSVPGQVQNVQASENDCQRVLVTWNALTGVDSFQVRRDGQRAGSTSGATTTFSDFNAQVGITYQYTVVAYNQCGAGSESQANSGQRILGALPPVSNVQATTNLCDTVVVTWNDIAGEDSFQVRRDGIRIGVRAANVTSFRDGTAMPNVNYLYTIVAYDECGAGTESDAATGSLAPRPNAVTGLTADLGCPTLELFWNVTANATEYRVERDGVQVGVVAHPGNSFVDDPGNNLPHQYRIVAANLCGPGTPSDPITAQRQGNTPPPTDLAVDASNCGIAVLTWTPTVGTQATIIYRNGAVLDTVDFATTSYADNPPAGLVEYYVTAYSTDCGESVASSSVTINVTSPAIFSQSFATNQMPPGWTVQHLGSTQQPWSIGQDAPGDFSPRVALVGEAASALEYLVSPVLDFTGATDLTITFISGMHANPGVFGYLEASLDGGATWPYELLTFLDNDTSIVSRRLSIVFNHATQARFRWKFTGSASQPGAWSVDDIRICGAVNGAPAPQAPAGFSVRDSIGVGGAGLTWSAVQSIFFRGYEVSVSQNDDMSDATVLTDFDSWLLGEIGLGDYVVNTLEMFEHYYFAVRTRDADGNLSDWSEIVEATVYPEQAGPNFENPLDEGTWWNELDGIVGAKLTDESGVDVNSIEIRVDANVDGIYDDSPEESWQAANVVNYEENGDVFIRAQFYTEGPSLKYELRARDIYGAEGYSGTLRVQGIEDDWNVKIDLTAPDQVEEFAPSNWATGEQIQLVWMPEEDLSGVQYEIYFATEPGVSENSTLWCRDNDPALSHAEAYFTTVEGLAAGTTYYFAIRAVDAAGNVGALSEEVSMTTRGVITPLEVSDLTLAVRASRVNREDLVFELRWSPVTTDVNGRPVTVTGYRIHASATSEFSPIASTSVAEVSGTNYVLTRELEESDLRYFVVTAICDDNNDGPGDVNPESLPVPNR